MKARKKIIDKLTPEELGVDLTPRLETLKVSEPPKRIGGTKVSQRCDPNVPADVSFRWRMSTNWLRSLKQLALSNHHTRRS